MGGMCCLSLSICGCIMDDVIEGVQTNEVRGRGGMLRPSRTSSLDLTVVMRRRPAGAQEWGCRRHYHLDLKK